MEPAPPLAAASRTTRRRARWLAWLVLAPPAMCLLGLPLLGVLLVALAFWPGGETAIYERHHSLSKTGRHKVAIIRVEGAILDGDRSFVKQQIDRVRDDEAVKAVVLRIDSPGGSVTGSDYLYHHLTRLRLEKNAAEKPGGLPMVVSMGGMAASGGYYVAMAVGDSPDVIYAEPTTWTGSIGVIIPLYNFSGLMERFDVQDTSVKSHPLKQMGAPTRKLSEEERRIFQELVDDSFSRFKQVIKSGRPYFRDRPEELDRLATGQVYTTSQALASRLVDREGYLEAAIDRAIELAGLDKGDVQVIDYERPFSLFDGLLAGSARSSQADELQALLELTAPRAYYLCTWLPRLAATRR